MQLFLGLPARLPHRAPNISVLVLLVAGELLLGFGFQFAFHFLWHIYPLLSRSLTRFRNSSSSNSDAVPLCCPNGLFPIGIPLPEGLG